MKNLPYTDILKITAVLVLFASVGTGLVAVSYEKTKDRIKYNEEQKLLETLNNLIPAALYDNALNTDTIAISNRGQLGSDKPVTIYRAYKEGRPIAVAFKPIAPDGYNGNIKLLVAIRYDGTLLGVRVVDHKETPGLGDKIETKSASGWIQGFTNLSLDKPIKEKWKVKADGGDFDQFTGATITPRAVVKAVKRSLEFFQVNRDELFNRQADAKSNQP